MKTLKTYFIAGLIFVALTGTLSHFVYEWSGCNPLAGFLTPVNESTWEHMKLIFFPAVIWSLFFSRHLSVSLPCLVPEMLTGTLLGTLAIPVLFYTYTGILGTNVAWIDISIFYISVILVFWYAHKTVKTSASPSKIKRTVSCLITVLFVFLFIIFSFQPPALGIFQEPPANAKAVSQNAESFTKHVKFLSVDTMRKSMTAQLLPALFIVNPPDFRNF